MDGTIEFWACNYSPANAANIPGASSEVFDFGDHINTEVPHGYGSMQIHNPAAEEVIFAYNNWKAMNAADLGIGNRPESHPDWTFSKSAGSYAGARLQVLIRPVK